VKWRWEMKIFGEFFWFLRFFTHFFVKMTGNWPLFLGLLTYLIDFGFGWGDFDGEPPLKRGLNDLDGCLGQPIVIRGDC
jgi:hypothetical protein